MLTSHLLGILLQWGWTPLHSAADIGRTEVVGQLLAARAFVDAAAIVRLTQPTPSELLGATACMSCQSWEGSTTATCMPD
jgi:hypothetical protein